MLSYPNNKYQLGLAILMAIAGNTSPAGSLAQGVWYIGALGTGVLCVIALYIENR